MTAPASGPMRTLGFDEVAAIKAEHGSPFYVFWPQRFEENLAAIRSAFADHYQPVGVGYSYKTNYLPAACRIAQRLGAYAEVVSRLEYDLAVRLGYPGERIIWNGPVKRYSDVEEALEQGVLLNLDAPHEIDHVARFRRLHPDAQMAVGLRVNIDLTDESGSSRMQGDVPVGRFGFDDPGLAEAVAALERLGVEVTGLHAHASSSDRGVANYTKIASRLTEVRAGLGLNAVRWLDVGGGFFGPAAEAILSRSVPSFADYADAVASVLLADPWVRQAQPELIVEPGVSVTADALSFVTKVHDTKQVAGKAFVVIDGNIYNDKPTMHAYNHPASLVPQAERTGDGPPGGYDVVGSTCMEVDVTLRNAQLGDVRPGDFIQIDGVGAYSIVMSPPFINPAPAIVSWDGLGFQLVRRPETFDEFFATYVI